jgi:hypothetical protein
MPAPQGAAMMGDLKRRLRDHGTWLSQRLFAVLHALLDFGYDVGSLRRLVFELDSGRELVFVPLHAVG